MLAFLGEIDMDDAAENEGGEGGRAQADHAAARAAAINERMRNSSYGSIAKGLMASSERFCATLASDLGALRSTLNASVASQQRVNEEKSRAEIHSFLVHKEESKIGHKKFDIASRHSHLLKIRWRRRESNAR